MARLPHRIAFCITELDPGGAERALVQIVTRLDRQQWTPRVFCLSGRGALANVLENRGVEVEFLDARSPRDVRIIGRLSRRLAAFDPDILQTFLFHANLAGRFAARRAGVPIVISGVRVVEHDARWRMVVDRWTHLSTTRSVCVSQAVASAYAEVGFPREKLCVIPNGVDSARFADAAPLDLNTLQIPDGSTVALSVGRLHSQKGFDILLEAVPGLLAKFDNLHVLIAGEGPQRRELAERIDSSPAAGRIRLLGRRDDVPELMRAADLFVHPARWEGMPNVILEAMAAGLPIVATDVEGVAELLGCEESGLIVPPEDSDALAAAISRLLSDPTLAARLGRTARERASTVFSWEKTVERYVELWAGLLSDAESR